ncbi:MAG TPA: hypothetical protein VFR81_05655 [Longimicrobium sp.]|nr:hypothetical protein [Longimicrobium sp.]
MPHRCAMGGDPEIREPRRAHDHPPPAPGHAPREPASSATPRRPHAACAARPSDGG